MANRSPTLHTERPSSPSAEAGLAQPASTLPHADRIQASFGRHDVSGIQAHVGGAATAASAAMGAEAYATGDHVGFRDSPDLHTAAHEAAHVIQQRAGVSLKGGVGDEGDPYEQHADAVADAVVAGRSAESLLDTMVPAPASAAAAVQRKNLTQHGKAGGLADTGATGVLVNRTKEGKVYGKAEGTAQGNRTAALTKASEHAAEVGNRTVGLAWTKDSQNFNDDAVDALDPFLFKIQVPFRKDDADQELTLTYQHAERWTGYVVGIHDTTNDATDGGVTMFNQFEAPTRDTDKYGNVHDTKNTGSTKVSSDTEGDEEHNLDAYTKIAGEGARWMCVRNHAANLQNDSLFFTAHDSSDTKVFAITFQQLWLNWTGQFGARYSIADADVVKAINGTLAGKKGTPLLGARRAVDKSTLTSKDYDLDAGRGHIAPKKD